MIFDLKRLLGATVAIPCALFAAQAAEPWQVVSVSEMSIAGTLKDGTEFEVRIEAKKPKEPRDNYFGAAGQPELVVSEIVVKVGGKKTSFPKQAFEDLANPLLQTVSVTSQPSGEVKLRFTGGDRAPTYEVEYFVQSDRLLRREVTFVETLPDGAKREVVKTTTF